MKIVKTAFAMTINAKNVALAQIVAAFAGAAAARLARTMSNVRAGFAMLRATAPKESA